ncbi:hypothetical protein KSB_84460 [Ktedonobacter robiniae]|uniref:Uncharacterized protein n=1 Tax=Ktedonobacter robiniae TaxID=2778365 RepID=A0ABQ3V4T3_9CHLR|nr:hypothetical protein KSB_84460 [Ktedonobacter robiniae]
MQIGNMTARPKPKKEEAAAKGSPNESPTTGGTAAAGEHYLPNGATAKSGLNKSILDAVWGRFITLCACKAEDRRNLVSF